MKIQNKGEAYRCDGRLLFVKNQEENQFLDEMTFSILEREL